MIRINRFLLPSRILIFIFWITLIFVFLYFPLLKNRFFTKNSITILSWADMIDLNSVSKFERETGIKVNVNYYENNEELFAKLQVTQGQEYDLITITDNGVDYLRCKKLIKKIDKTKLVFWEDIDSHFLSHYYDPYNEYSIPYNWDIYGLGVNTNYFKNYIINPGWGLIFEHNKLNYKISMIDDAFDAVLIAAKYLYGTIDSIDKIKLAQIQELLIKQKDLVEVYTDLRADYFLKLGICPVVVAQSAYIYRAIQENSDFAFLMPKEGSFMIIDSLVIPALSKKDTLVYKFINFLYKEEEIRNFVKKFGYLPVLKDILYSLNLDYIGGLDNIFLNENFGKLSFFRRVIPRNEISKLWVSVKAS